LQRQVKIGGSSPDLDIAAQTIEAEHVRLDDPCARRHAIEPEPAVIVGERHQAALALGGAHRGAGNRLVGRFDSARLRQRDRSKYKRQAHCQKHENLEH
jgi:hypothetical protein